MNTVLVVLGHRDYEDSIDTVVHGVYQDEQQFRDEARDNHYEYDSLNDTYYTVLSGQDVQFEMVHQVVKGTV